MLDFMKISFTVYWANPVKYSIALLVGYIVLKDDNNMKKTLLFIKYLIWPRHWLKC